MLEYRTINIDDEVIDFLIKYDIEESSFNDSNVEKLTAWEVVDDALDKRVGVVITEKRYTHYLIGSIAVDEDYRGQDIGKKLVQIALDDLKKYHPDKILLTAKVPLFFAKFGFKEISIDKYPEISYCYDCNQYNKTCFPKAMELIL